MRRCVRGAVWWLPARDGVVDKPQTEGLPGPWHIELSASRALSTSRTVLCEALTEAMRRRVRE